ncbi:acetyltransferase [Nocardioides sp. Root140]|uniref:acetyltransferase n=1 Tax=Nocardioides sp. Root140 TaxID=1736460 RepID=UPI000AE9B632|nr:acetyltransferase [Nocardioides sp. Root140]
MSSEPVAVLTPWISVGAGGHAASVAHALLGVAELVAVAGVSTREWSVDVLDSDADAIALAQQQDRRLVVTIGENRRRLEVIDQLPPDLLFSAAANTSTVSADVTLGGSSVVLHHAHVGPGARVGRGVIVNTAAVVEHDVTLGDGVHVAPGAVVLGGASVGAGTFVGSGATILPGVTVGAHAVIGAGAVVTRDVPENACVVGVPAVERHRTERTPS